MNGDYNTYFELVEQFQFYNDQGISNRVSFNKYRHLGVYHGTFLRLKQAKIEINKALEYARKSRAFDQLSEGLRVKAFIYTLDNQKIQRSILPKKPSSSPGVLDGKIELAQAFNQQSKIYEHFGQLELGVSKNLVAFQLAMSINNHVKMACYSRKLGVNSC